MKRLTSFSKIIILFTIIGIFYFLAQYIKNNKDDLLQSLNKPTKELEKNTATEDQSASLYITSSFDYIPQRPIGGKLYGVVELGASGFNSFIINKDSDDNWERVKYEWGNSMVIDGIANEADIINGLKRYIINILDYGVDGRNIHFVVSSGASKEPITKSIIKALKQIGYIVNVVTPDQEGQYALRSVLPTSYYNSAFVVDMGSSNTKISWKDGHRIIAKEADGSKYYKKDITDSDAYKKVLKHSLNIPKSHTETCFIIGGVPYKMAEESRELGERYTVLGPTKNYDDLGHNKGKKVRSGLNIYQGIIDGTGCNQFVFDWDANFTIGFLLTLPN